MRLYCGIDLHSNNSFVVIIDETDKVVYQRRHRNDLEEVAEALEPYRGQIVGVVVESTFNWYWLVDGLMDAGMRVHLANTAAIQQYSGLKHADDKTDARWLAHLLRLDVLPTGYIYPRERRALRDLLRKRISLVQLRTSTKLSLQNLSQRNLGRRFSSSELRSMATQGIDVPLEDGNLILAMDSTLEVTVFLDELIGRLEQEILRQTRPLPAFKLLKSVSGIGNVLAQTILLETGELGRFPSVGNYASYCRCVNSTRISNQKVKGRGNTKNGNRYLAWAFVEAANFAIRFYPEINRYYQRKMSKTHRIVALKAVSHKLARASYYVMRDRQPFDLKRAFG